MGSPGCGHFSHKRFSVTQNLEDKTFLENLKTNFLFFFGIYLVCFLDADPFSNSYFFSPGFCIAKPKPLRVFQDFFLSVNLPYSVKRNEQLQVKAVVYNYKEESLKVNLMKLYSRCYSC